MSALTIGMQERSVGPTDGTTVPVDLRAVDFTDGNLERPRSSRMRGVRNRVDSLDRHREKQKAGPAYHAGEGWPPWGEMLCCH